MASDALTFKKFIDQVEKNHPKLAGAKLQQKIATAKRIEKQGAFDPAIRIGNDWMRYNSTSKKGDAKEAFDNDVSLDFLTRSGIKYSLGGRYNTDDVKSPGSPTGDGGDYFIGMKIPLLRNLGVNEKSAAEDQAFIGESLAETFQQRVRLDLLLNAGATYWDWVIASKKCLIQQNILKLAEDRAKAVRYRAAAGDIPVIDSVEAEQEVQRRQGQLTKAERDFQKATYKLATYLWENQSQPSQHPTQGNVPTDWQNPTTLADDVRVKAQDAAVQYRPELKSIQLERQITDIDKKLAKNQRLPEVNLVLGPSFDTGNNGIGPSGKIAIETTIPLRRRTATGQLLAAKYKLEKLSLDQQMLIQQVSLEVDDALSAIDTTYDRFVAAQKELVLAQQLEAGERQKFDLGDSTIFLVNQRERASAEASIKLLETHAEYEVAHLTLLAATGQL